ncbi:hypothetical protein [Leucothrix mucor]|uniref:hypothetical protein n=1 Tax=Leucothrix mucor TaxID=45248 RepID=UPI0012F71EF0|nr:hypothetical protein [Leucothrix mucor]
MNSKLMLLTVCSILVGCVGQEGEPLSSKELPVSQSTLTEDSLLNASKSIAATQELSEVVVNDDLPEDEAVASVHSLASAPLVGLKSSVGAYDVGGYACNVVSTPGEAYTWSIKLYNLNDSLQTERVIFGVNNNRNIQSVACTPDGSHALFSIREFARGDYEVYSIDLLTNEVTQLTDNDTDDVDVSMSVDGLVMAWQERLADGRQGITMRTYNADKTAFTQKGIASAVPFVQPSLSPNGEWLALVQLRPSRFLALRYDVKNGGFSEIRAIARRKKLYHPSISDDGNIFSWVENAKQNRFFIKDISGDVLTEYFNHEAGTEHPFLSFDGQWISYSINSDAGAKTYLTNISTGETSTIGTELASPGRYLATSWMGTIIIPQVLSLEVATNTMLESGSAMLATVTRSGPLVEPLVVNLSSSDSSELKVPASVTFNIGETSKSFYLTPVDDDDIDGTQPVTISASAVGADTVLVEMSVEDDGEILDELSIKLNRSSISETDGSAIATVTRSGPTDSALIVTLSSSNSSDATVPKSVTIPAGAASATFKVTAIQDLANDGNQTVVIEASASGLTTGVVSLLVKDVPVDEVEETQVSLDANGNVSVFDIGDTSTAEDFNITVQTVDGAEFLQIQGLNGHNMQINQVGDTAAYINSRVQTVVRIPLGAVNSLKIDTKGGADVINMRASLSLSGGVSLIADTINLLAAEISTETGNLSLQADKEIILSSSTLSSKSGKIDLAANMNGDACLSTSGNSVGVNLLNGSAIKSVAGDISVKGCGGVDGSKNIGVLLSDSGGQIQSSGSGNITIVGHAGSGESNNTGVLVQGAQSFILSESGSLDIQGFGSLESSGDFNQGVSLTDGASIASNANTDQVKDNRVSINVVGVGGKSTNNSNHGISISKLSGVHSESADLMINGVTAGKNIDSNDSSGVYLNSDGVLSAKSGSMTVEADIIKVLATKISTGDGDLKVLASRNVVLSGGGLVTEGGDLTVSANASMSMTSVDLSGSSCTDVEGNFIGVDLVSASYLSSDGGDIRVVGCGGISGDNNVGVRLGSTGGKIVSSGAGSVSIAGLAGTGGELNVGLLVQGDQSLVQAAAGSIDVYGAGSSLSTGDFNPGVAIQNGGSIVSSASEQQVATNSVYARVSGVGGISHNDDNHGVIINGDGSRIHTEAANLQVKGFTRGLNFGSATSVGMDVNNSGEVSSTQGDITIEGGTVNILATNISAPTSDLTILATRNLLLSDANLSTDTGRIHLAANINTGGTPEDVTDDVCLGTKGNFVGVEMLAGSSIKSDDGSIFVSGCGGTSGNANIGLRLAITGGAIAATGNGSVWAKGIAGTGTNNNIGVTVKGADSAITSAKGSLTVMGYGSSSSTGEFNPGLAVQELGTIASTGNNIVNLIGVGGSSPKTDNHGIIVSGLGSKVAISNAMLNISASGGGSESNPGSNVGFYVNGGATVQSTGTGNITISANGGLGLDNNDGVRIGGETDDGDSAEIISSLGNITIRGTASGQTKGDGNKGVRVNAGGKVTALSDANINIYGMAGAGGSTNQGIQVAGDIKAEKYAQISAVNGHIVLTGDANDSGTGDGNTGVNIMNYGFVETSGAGSITVTGSGGFGGLNHYGVGLYNGGEIRTTGTGQIDIDGTGGTGNLGNSGLRLAGQLPEENPNNLPLLYAKISSAHGDINIKAQAGPGDGGAAPTTSPWDKEDHGMQGVYLTHGGWIEALGTASINIVATGGDGYNETNGVFIEGEDNFGSEEGHEKGLESFITSVDGDINIEGYGSTKNAVGNSLGVALLFAQINATGSGNIKIKGVGGSGNKRPTHGIQINQIGSQISAFNGSIDLVGIGGVGIANGNVGVKLVDGGRVVVLGTNPDASINIDGVGGAVGRSANHGVQVSNGTSSTDLTSIEGINGNVTVVGVAGGNGLGDSNFGVSLSGTTAGGGGQIISHGSAKLYVVGTGGSGVNSNGGVQIASGESKISSTAGNIEVVGVASNDSVGEANAGVLIQTGGKIESNGSASIFVRGTGGLGAINEGVVIMDEGAAIASTEGEVIITAIGGDQAEDIRFYDPTQDAVNYIGGPEASGNITLNIDTINSVLGSIQSKGQLLIKPRTEGLTIGLAAGAEDGILNFGASELTSLVNGFSKITIGTESSGQITLGALVSNDPMVLKGSNIQGLTTSPVHIDMQDDTTMILSGQVSPNRDESGRSVGQLVVNGRLKLEKTANLLMKFRGLNPGNAYDQIIVNGFISLNSANLDVTFFGGFTPQPGDTFVIVSNDGTEPVAGIFAGLPEGSTLTVSGIPLTISYVGGDGNDVQLSY